MLSSIQYLGVNAGVNVLEHVTLTDFNSHSFVHPAADLLKIH